MPMPNYQAFTHGVKHKHATNISFSAGPNQPNDVASTLETWLWLLNVSKCSPQPNLKKRTDLKA